MSDFLKALILNSGMGTRMGTITDNAPKCMTEIGENETILSRQLKLLRSCSINDVIITTGYLEQTLCDYCRSVAGDMNITFVKNPLYMTTNYIYSVYLARELLRNEDIIFMHGDLVFDKAALDMTVAAKHSTMVVSSTQPIPKGDFKAVISGERITAIGVNLFENCLAAQPLYKLFAADFSVWLKKIENFCSDGSVTCYAENAFNEVSDKCPIFTLDVKDILCGEIDCPEDLKRISEGLVKNK